MYLFIILVQAFMQYYVVIYLIKLSSIDSICGTVLFTSKNYF